MRNYPALRLGGQFFFCAGVLSFFEPFCRDLRVFWLLCALSLVSGLIACRLEHPLLRALAGLIPGLALLLPTSGWLPFAAAAALVLYGAVLLATDSFRPEAWAYRREAGWTLALCVLLAIISFFFTASGAQTLWLLLCAALLVLLALQMLQNCGSMGLAWQAGGVGGLLLTILVCVLLGLGVWACVPLLQKLFTFFATIIMGLAALALLFYALLWKIFAGDATGKEWPFEENTLPDLFFQKMGSKGSAATGTDEKHIGFDIQIPWMELLIAAVLVLLILLAIRFVRRGGIGRFRRRFTVSANSSEALQKKQRRRREDPKPLTNQEKLRFIYSQYLSYLKTKDILLQESDTTADISSASSELFFQTDELLRDLYRKARYSTGEISDEELAAAGEALNNLISEDNLRERSV